MRTNYYLWGLCALGHVCHALPSGSKVLEERSETADADDTFVYTWSVPEEQKFKRAEIADADDTFVYTWSIPDEEEGAVKERAKREETVDADDTFVYAWSNLEEKIKV